MSAARLCAVGLLGVVLSCPAYTQQRNPQPMNDLVFECATARLVLGEQGRLGIKSLTDRATGVEHVEQAGSLYIATLGDDTRLVSHEATRVEVQHSGPHTTALRFEHDNEIAVSVTVKADPKAPWFLFQIALHTAKPIRIKEMWFPRVCIPPTRGTSPAAQSVLVPYADGLVCRDPQKVDFRWGVEYYPGFAGTQMGAFWDDTAGTLLAPLDPDGHVKRVGVSRWDRKSFWLEVGQLFPSRDLRGEIAIPYPIALATFRGDWRDAADLYGGWARKQAWCRTRWVDRDDVPDWLKEGAVVHTYWAVRKEEDGWKGKTIEIKSPETIAGDMKGLSDLCGVPNLLWPFVWEKHDIWTGGDYLPPLMGWEAFDDLQRCLAADGNHAFMTLSGFKWVFEWRYGERYSETFSNRDLLERTLGDVVCVDENGQWIVRRSKPGGWDSVAGILADARICRGSKKGRDWITGVAAELMDHGADGFHFDQEVSGGAGDAFCAARDHGHDPGWGTWLWKGMADTLDAMRAEGRKRGIRVVLSIEAPSETLIPHLATYQARDYCIALREGVNLQNTPMEPISLFNYLYHEYLPGYSAVMYGSHVGWRIPEVARAVATGNLPGIAIHRVPWPGQHENYQTTAYVADWARAWAGFAHDFLAAGRMGRPLDLHVPIDDGPEIEGRHKEAGTYRMKLPRVQNSTWALPDGRWGAVLASGHGEPVECRIETAALPRAEAWELTSSKGSSRLVPEGGSIHFAVEPRTVYLLRPAD